MQPSCSPSPLSVQLRCGRNPRAIRRDNALSDVTRLLEAARRGDPQAAADLLPFVYDELRKLAAAQLAREAPGNTLEATALVHEAYLRLVGPDEGAHWD